jgi:hypothetical protein
MDGNVVSAQMESHVSHDYFSGTMCFVVFVFSIVCSYLLRFVPYFMVCANYVFLLSCGSLFCFALLCFALLCFAFGCVVIELGRLMFSLISRSRPLGFKIGFGPITLAVARYQVHGFL